MNEAYEIIILRSVTSSECLKVNIEFNDGSTNHTDFPVDWPTLKEGLASDCELPIAEIVRIEQQLIAYGTARTTIQCELFKITACIERANDAA
jgi:hypothetical protein